MTGFSLDVRSQSKCKLCPAYAVILYGFFLKSVRIPAKNPYNLTNKSAARSNINHYVACLKNKRFPESI